MGQQQLPFLRAAQTSIKIFTVFLAFWMLAPTKSSGQCDCALVVGSGQGVRVTYLSQVPSAQNLDNACIRIKGNFYIDDQQIWNLTNQTQVYLDPGASIYVEDGSGINATDECVFQKCNPSAATWGSIICLTNSSITMDRCSLYDAQTAITLNSSTTFWLTYNRFEDCGSGLRIYGMQSQLNHQVKNNQFLDCSYGIQIFGSSVRINYNWFYHATSNIMIGVNINGGQSVAINDCILTNQKLGVEVNGTVNNITLNNLTISGNRGVHVRDCYLNFGVYRSSIRTQQEGVLIERHQTSLGSKFGSAVVDGSYVSSISRSAIKAQNTFGNGRLHVQGNTVRPAYDPPSFAHYGIEIDFVPNSQVFVKNNWVSHLSYIPTGTTAPGGIYLKKCQRQTLVEGNEIEAGPYGKLDQGIILVESKNVQLVGNSVRGGSPWMDLAGISIGKSPENVLVCCNTIDSTEIGLQITEAISNYDIAGTVFKNHEAALYYGMVAALSDESQNHRGNDWGNAATTWDGVYQGNFAFIPYTRYFVNSSHLADDSKITVNGGGNDDDWFTIENEAEYTCSSYCGHTAYTPVFAAPGGSGTITDNDMWAADDLGDLPGYTAIHWDARRDLYGKLVQYPGLLNQNATIDDFYEEAEEGNIGVFHAVVDGLVRLHEPPSNIAEDYYDAYELLADRYADLNALDETIEEADSTELPGLLDQRDSMVADIEITLAETVVYDSIIAAAVPQRLNDLITLNASADPEADYEEYQQDINVVYLNALYDDDWDFDSTTQAAIDAIAELCPQDAGRAVYDARGLQEHYRVPTWTNCAPIDAPRTSATTPKPPRNGFVAYPNPVTDQVQIILDAPAAAGGWLLLTDMTGRILTATPVAVGATGTVIQTGEFQSGVYLLQIRQANAPVLQQKLTIIR
ncbi:MAG: right-handed parallel beta-helix repeat-containing protein [Saprospiraceae bacterium]